MKHTQQLALIAVAIRYRIFKPGVQTNARTGRTCPLQATATNIQQFIMQFLMLAVAFTLIVTFSLCIRSFLRARSFGCTVTDIRSEHIPEV